MTRFKTEPATPSRRGVTVRQRVLDAAERLLAVGNADFSMRDLAAEAEVSFATPFNQFGNKGAIMLALSGRRIETMLRHFAEAPRPASAASRVQLATDIATAVMLSQPAVNRALVGWIGTASSFPGQVLAHSTALWSLALETGEGAPAMNQAEELQNLSRQLAFGFRGVLSFWAAGELPDDALAFEAKAIACSLLNAGAAQTRVPATGNSITD
jgi:AcrR family transcriptional regulator